jgi:hypothetical protein
MKELKDMPDTQFLTILLNEREGDCTNVYAPLTKRIRATRLRLEQGDLTGYFDREEKGRYKKVLAQFNKLVKEN